MRRTWTVASASAYIIQHVNDTSRGLKYCSALDYMRNHAPASEIAALRETSNSPKKKQKP